MYKMIKIPWPKFRLLFQETLISYAEIPASAPFTWSGYRKLYQNLVHNWHWNNYYRLDQISSNKLNDVTSRGRQPVLHVSRPAVRAARVEAGGRCCTCRRRRPVLDSGARLGLYGSRPLVLVRSGGHTTPPAATRVGDDREEAGGRRKTKLDHDQSFHITEY